MISVITCSINPEKLEGLRRNLTETIGEVPFELIAIDNRKSPKSIAAAYNEGASKAIYPYLLFIHEDAGFVDKDWTGEIVKKLSEQDCGVIGFAGSQLMLNAPGGWNVMPKWCVWYLMENGSLNRINTDERTPAFKEVVAVDGFAMFVRKEVWVRYPFDENAIRGFHCYDVDFSLSVGIDYKNYVCTNILLYHDSEGNFGEAWVQETRRVYKEKWNKVLPRYASDVTLSKEEEEKIEERVCWRFLKTLKEFGIKDSDILNRFKDYPLSIRHLRHLIKAKISM